MLVFVVSFLLGEDYIGLWTVQDIILGFTKTIGKKSNRPRVKMMVG